MSLRIDLKTYCLLTPQVSGIGGAQLYALRRASYLKNKGFRVILLIADSPDKPLKDKFETFQIIQYPELIFPVFNYSGIKLNSILQSIINKLDVNDYNLVLESHTLSISIWGELLAERLACKHIIYPLNERPITYWEFMPVKDFFLWKLNRGEFIGPSDYSLRAVLSSFYNPEKAIYANIGFDPDELPEISYPDVSDFMNKGFFKIGTVSRLSKPYIRTLIKNVMDLSLKYPEKKIALIIGGDDPDKSIREKLKNKYAQKGNLRIMFPGYINPLGKDFFRNLDIFVGMATAAINSISSHCATITVDPISKKSAGFFGLTTKDTMFAEQWLLLPIVYWLEMAITNPVLIEDSKKAGSNLFRREYMHEVCMQKIENLIAISDSSRNYWRFPKEYLSSRFLNYRYRTENSRYYRFLQKIYGLRIKFSLN